MQINTLPQKALSDFVKDYISATEKRIINALAIGFFVNSFFIYFDRIFGNDYFFYFLKLRIIINFCCICGVIFIKFPRSKKGSHRASIIFIVVGTCVQLSMAEMSYYTGGYTSFYNSGYVIVFVYLALSGWFYVYCLISFLITSLIFFSQAFIRPDVFTYNSFHFISWSWTLISVGVMTSLSFYFQHKMRLEIKIREFYKTNFIQNMNHELKTPLSLILSPAYELQRKNKDPKKNFLLSQIIKNAKNLRKLIQNILDISKLETGSLSLQINHFYLSDAIEETLINLKDIFNEKNIHHEFITKANPIISADRDHIKTIMENLYTNAIKFSDKKNSKIQTIIEETNKKVKVTVIDFGIGIPKSEHTKIFERFYQSDIGLSRSNMGSGIGLHFSQDLAKLHKSEIKVESKVGKGSSFTFELHKGDDWYKDLRSIRIEDFKRFDLKEEDVIELDKTIKEEQKEIKTNNKKLKTILIVEDNKDLCSYINSLLEENYFTRMAFNGKEALKILEETKIDIILTDIMMPEMNGIELLEHVKNHPKHSNIPVIIITAHGDKPDDIEETFKIGCDDYLLKPFSPQELEVRISNIEKNLDQKDEIKEFQAELARKNNLSALGNLSAGVAHNINTYMSGADMALSTILKNIDRAKEHQELIETTIGSIRSTKEIVTQLESFSKNSRAYQEETYNLTQAIKETVKIFLLNQNYFSLNFHYDTKKKVIINGSSHLLKTSLINLFKNSAEANAENIWISIEDENSTYKIKIKDDGDGMNEETASKIFEPFFTTKDINEGTGLGLWMVYKNITEQGGEIQVESQVGQGTEFTISFKKIS